MKYSSLGLWLIADPNTDVSHGAWQVQAECFSGDGSRGYAGEWIPQRLLRLYGFPSSHHTEVSFAAAVHGLSRTVGNSHVNVKAVDGARLRFSNRKSVAGHECVCLQGGRCARIRALGKVSTHLRRLADAPLCCFSHVRETMVKIMLSSTSRQRSALEGECGVAAHFETSAATMRLKVGHKCDGDELPMGPSTCVFWCAIAWDPWSRAARLSR